MSGMGRRGSRVLAACLLTGAALAFIWPVHALVTRFEPLIFGIPFSLAWIILGQVTVFAGLVLLFLTEG